MDTVALLALGVLAGAFISPARANPGPAAELGELLVAQPV
jgi:hypothetical protein